MIKPKKKICKSCGKERFIWGQGMCKSCWSKQRAIDARRRVSPPVGGRFSTQGYKNPTKGVKSSKKPMSPRKKKDTVTDKWLKSHWGFSSQRELFDWLWEGGCEQKCPYTGEDLKGYYHQRSMRHILCAHRLPKGKYPLYKLNRDNVVLVYPGFHTLVDQGRLEDRLAHPLWSFKLWDEEVAALKVEYEEFKQKYLL